MKRNWILMLLVLVGFSPTTVCGAEHSAADFQRRLKAMAGSMKAIKVGGNLAKAGGERAISIAAREGESAALAKFKVGIDKTCASAMKVANWIDEEGYKTDKDGLEALLALTDEAAAFVRKQHSPKDSFSAYMLMRDLNVASCVLSDGLLILRRVKGPRDEAKLVRDDVNLRLLPRLDAATIAKSAQPHYEAGLSLMKKGDEAYAKWEFAEAKFCYQSARDSFLAVRSRMIVLSDVPVPDRD